MEYTCRYKQINDKFTINEPPSTALRQRTKFPLALDRGVKHSHVTGLDSFKMRGAATKPEACGEI